MSTTHTNTATNNTEAEAAIEFEFELENNTVQTQSSRALTDKVKTHDIESMTDEELLALLLETKTGKFTPSEAAAIMKRTCINLNGLARFSFVELKELFKNLGLTDRKAAKIVAAFELGKRAVCESVNKQRLGSPAEIYQYLFPRFSMARQEHLIILLFDIHQRLIGERVLNIGTTTRVITHPRDIFAEAIKVNAYQIILVHNHPTGDCTPSNADIELTDVIHRAGKLMMLPLRDHVIIGRPLRDGDKGYYSFRESGRL